MSNKTFPLSSSEDSMRLTLYWSVLQVFNKYECLCFILSLSFSSQSLSAIWEPSFTGLNYLADSKPDPGGGISDLGTLKLSAKWQPGARVSICTLQHIGQLFQQIRFAESMGDTKECFPMNYCVWKCFVRCRGLQHCMVLLSLLSALIPFPSHSTGQEIEIQKDKK